MRRPTTLWVCAVTAGLCASQADAKPPELAGLVRADRPAGCSDYTFLIWDLYRAELWSDARPLPGEIFGLSMTYRTDFTRSKLVETSIDEMARISGRSDAELAAARHELTQAFRDVDIGDRITAVRTGPERLRLFLNGLETGALTQDVDLFLAIWLSETTRNAEGRAALLSGTCDG